MIGRKTPSYLVNVIWKQTISQVETIFLIAFDTQRMDNKTTTKWDVLCLRSSRSKYNALTINYLFVVVFLHFDIKQNIFKCDYDINITNVDVSRLRSLLLSGLYVSSSKSLEC